MGKQIWECEPQSNGRGGWSYHDIVATISDILTAPTKANYGWFQDVNVLFQGTPIKVGFYYHGELTLEQPSALVTPAERNVELALQVKVEPSTRQDAYQGKKYTLRRASHPAGGTQRQSSSSYTPDTPNTVLGKCETLFIEATLASGKFVPSTLMGNDLELNAIAALAAWCQRERH